MAAIRSGIAISKYKNYDTQIQLPLIHVEGIFTPLQAPFMVLRSALSGSGEYLMTLVQMPYAAMLFPDLIIHQLERFYPIETQLILVRKPEQAAIFTKPTMELVCLKNPTLLVPIPLRTALLKQSCMVVY